MKNYLDIEVLASKPKERIIKLPFIGLLFMVFSQKFKFCNKELSFITLGRLKWHITIRRQRRYGSKFNRWQIVCQDAESPTP